MCIGYMQILCHLYKGLEHPWILVSAKDPGTNPLQVTRDDRIWQSLLSRNLGPHTEAYEKKEKEKKRDREGESPDRYRGTL